MVAANQSQQSQAHAGASVVQHANAKGMEEILGIGKANRRLNTHAHDLQFEMEEVRDAFLELRQLYVSGIRHDFLREGMLGEIVQRTPIFVYDLPELVAAVPTAFVDATNKMFIAEQFARRLLDENRRGLDSLNFLIRHEADHLRRNHLVRMLDLPHEIANIAQDIRINIDITKGVAADRYAEKNNRQPSKTELLEEVQKYLLELAPTAVSIGWAMRYDQYIKYDGKSEEEIAAILMQEWKDAPAIPNREVSFVDIMEGAAQEADNVKLQLQNGVQLPPTPAACVMTPAELSSLATDLRRIGKAKANPKQVTTQELQDAKDRLLKLKLHQGLLELDLQHSRAAMALAGQGASHLSGNTNDAYLNALKPSERVQVAIAILDKILAPQNASSGMPNSPQNGGVTVKDLERSMGRGQGGQGNGESSAAKDPNSGDDSSASQSKGNPDLVPAPNVFHDNDHVLDTNGLVDLLRKAGVNEDTLEKLGYSDLGKIAEEKGAAKNNITAAINKATEDQMKLGERYPGGHLLNYAKAQMLDFFKPVLTWQMIRKKILQELGRGQRHDPAEAWMIYHVDHADMGFKHQRDVPYMGSMVPGKAQRPLCMDIYDTSGSVDDAMLKRFYSEGINMSRKISRGNVPDVIHVAADTIARGEPVYITEKNYKTILKKGINYGGRGGTNFQASLENAFELVKPGGKRTPYSGRDLEAIFYFTDTGDSAPDFKRLEAKARECGMKKIPTIVFIAPKMCFNDSFNQGIKGKASIVYFDSGPKAVNKTHIDVDKLAADQEAGRAGVVATKPSLRP